MKGTSMRLLALLCITSLACVATPSVASATLTAGKPPILVPAPVGPPQGTQPVGPHGFVPPVTEEPRGSVPPVTEAPQDRLPPAGEEPEDAGAPGSQTNGPQCQSGPNATQIDCDGASRLWLYLAAAGALALGGVWLRKNRQWPARPTGEAARS